MESKNMHVIPTDKPSRLVRNGKKLLLVDIPKNYTFFGITVSVNIYITNDEEIEEGNWFITKANDILKAQKPEKGYEPTGKKIILTTDQDLIKDGVQAIDDEFLEWFVKNPSCEEVKVDWVDFSWSYFINIPKQSTKDRILSETPELVKQKVREMANDLVGNSKQDWFCPKCNSYVSAESVTFEENHQICNTGVIVKEEPKQETLEESAEQYAKSKTSHKTFQETYKRDFIAGVKWQQERMYSEEEVINTIQQLKLKSGVLKWQDDFEFDLEEWFEQFKKITMHGIKFKWSKIFTIKLFNNWYLEVKNK